MVQFLWFKIRGNMRCIDISCEMKKKRLKEVEKERGKKEIMIYIGSFDIIV